MNLEQEIKKFLGKHACERYEKTDTLKDIIRKWHEPFGVEFCQKFNYPDIALIRRCKDEFEQYGVYVDRKDLIVENQDVILFNCIAELHYKRPEKRYSVILYADNIVTLSAKEYAFVVCDKISEKNSVMIDTDDNAIVSILND